MPHKFKQTMKKAIFTIVFITLCCIGELRADEGMWLLQLMKEQHLDDQMKKLGLQISADDIYQSDSVSLKDVVGIFGGGCTAEVISPNGLLITNHHCGYSSIQSQSSLEHNYLRDGFWSNSLAEELPCEHLTFTMVERIVDVTDSVLAKIASSEITEEESFTSQFLYNYAQLLFSQSDLYEKPGIEVEIEPFYAGNRYYLFFYKRYRDIRLVATPPSSIGKFGNETDNWMWPRHTGDFSVFRIYADENGEPASYSESNVPLKCKKYLPISSKGVEEGDFAMILGFPGRTSRFLTRSEVEQRMYTENEPRIMVRDACLKVLREEMEKDEQINIQYASTFAGISNYWKNSIGMNKALIDNHVLERKSAEEELFLAFAREMNNEDYLNIIDKINAQVNQFNESNYIIIAFSEVFGSIDFGNQLFSIDIPDKKDKEKRAEFEQMLRDKYSAIHHKNYDHEVDRKIAKAVLPLLAQMTDSLPSIYEVIRVEYDNNFDRFIDDMYNNSIMSNEKNLEKFIKSPSKKAFAKDPATRFYQSVIAFSNNYRMQLADYRSAMNLLHKTYVRGLCEMYAATPKSPDANFTLRLTYGSVKSYEPRDGVYYNYYTTLDGVMEKEDTTSTEFIVPEKLKELYKQKDYGKYALPDGRMPVCFLTSNDITGGNSGSPVINGKGELLGLAFDGNWESLSGDLSFEADKQRCISVDIRYVLFIIEKYGNCKRLIDEMTIN